MFQQNDKTQEYDENNKYPQETVECLKADKVQ